MVILRDDVVAWYELQREEEAGKTWDEHAQLDGTINGATLSTDAPSSKFIGSFDFDGTNDYISISNYTFDTNTDFSIHLKVKIDSTSPSGYYTFLVVEVEHLLKISLLVMGTRGEQLSLTLCLLNLQLLILFTPLALLQQTHGMT